MKKLIKMNVDNSHLSYGNFSKYVKFLSKNKKIANQIDIFYLIFENEEISDTAVNNYIIGSRSINSKYKKIYLKYKSSYNKNKYILLNIIYNIISLIEGNLFNDDDKIYFINNSDSTYELCTFLFNLAKNDSSMTTAALNEIINLYHKKDYIAFLSKVLFFIILEKKQPLYEEDEKYDFIQNILNDTSIPTNDVKDYLKLKFTEGSNYDYKLNKLATNNNTYALYELGLNEYKGYITGKRRFDKAYDYFFKASINNHPGANYMVAHLIINKYVGSFTNKELNFASTKLNNAIKLGSVAAINLLGIMYLKGIYPYKKNLENAKKHFMEASTYDYAYAFNNLGFIEEKNNNIDKAFEYYKKSADLDESWASNKLALYFYDKKDFLNCYKYLNKGNNLELYNIYPYLLFNLSNIFLEKGFPILNIPKDFEKAVYYYELSANKNNLESQIKLLNIYINKYIDTRDNNLLHLIYKYKYMIESNKSFDNKIKKDIEDRYTILLKNLNLKLFL